QAKLEEDGGMAGISKDTHVLSELSAKSFIERDFVAVSSQHTLRELLNKVANSKRNIFPVLNENGTLAGVIYLENIREIMFNASLYDVTKVTDLMQPPVLTVDAEEPMSAIMEKFDKSGVWNIPVIQEGKYAGFISKSRIFSTYRERMKVD
ncbi:MAG TPA: CBS domain-containing protein, partial [Cyclobacteriaceae bacterium]|nr:CBS domain-containing protein [Cyclobacteriaceae bacterium]